MRRALKESKAGARGLFLPRTLLVPVRLQALPALVLVHLQTAFLLQVAHVILVRDTIKGGFGEP